MPNQDKDILDDIDALIATELDEHGVPLDDYERDRYPRCELCQGHWHGLPKASGCPGGNATDAEVEAWRAKAHKGFQEKSMARLAQYVCQIDGVLYRLELHGNYPDEMLLHATVIMQPDESYASGAYSYIPEEFMQLGFIDADGGPAVDSVND